MKVVANRRHWILLATAVGALALALAARGGGREASAGTWTRVESRDLDVLAPFTGRLRAVKVDEYGPPALPRIWEYRIAFIASEGSEVAAGEPLLRFDTTELEQNLRGYRADLEAAQKEYAERRKEFEGQTAEEQLALEEARAKERRAEVVANVPPDLVARSAREKAAVDLGLARDEVAHRGERIAYLARRSATELGVLRDRREHAAAAVAETERAIELMTLRAKRGGIVLHRANRRGDKRKVGDSCGRGERVLEIPQPGAMLIDASVEEPYSGGLRVGLPARLRLDAHPERELLATVASVRGTVEQRVGIDEGPVVLLELALESTDADQPRPGMRVQGSILIEDREPGLAIPIAAVDAGPSGPMVTTRGSFFLPIRRNVELGRRSGEWVELVAGLEAGSEVLARR